MELITSSKEDKRMFEEDRRELRRQLLDIQSKVQKASMDERRTMAEDSQQLWQQLASIENEVRKAASVNSSRSAESTAAAKSESQALEENLKRLRWDNTATFVQRVDFEAEECSTQYTITKQLKDRLNSLQKEVANARAYIGHASAGRVEPPAGRRWRVAATPGGTPAPSRRRRRSAFSSSTRIRRHRRRVAAKPGSTPTRSSRRQASPERLSQQHSQFAFVLVEGERPALRVGARQRPLVEDRAQRQQLRRKS